MQAFICFSNIIIFACLTCTETFVVTRYDSSTITEYYNCIISHYESTRNLFEFFDHQNRSQFCHQLRESSFFDMTNNTDTSDINYSQFISNNYSIGPNELSWEAEQEVSRESHRFHMNRVRTLPTFRCLDPRGSWSRAIFSGYVPNTAFMSTYHIGFRASQDILRKWNAELIAIIDASPVILTEIPNFNNFIEARKGLQRDPLCDLNRLVKFRLCAAASVILGDVDHRYDELHPYNLYYQPDNDEESCRYLEGIDWTSGRYPKMLLCSVKLTNSRVFKSFYLGLDVLQSNNVFVIRRVWNESQYIHQIQYIQVPLLEHLEVYVEAFNTTDI